MKPNWERAQRERDIFSCNFRRVMELRGKTQSDISADLEITSSTVSDWANAKKYPRVDKMQVLANYLGVLISELREERLTPVSKSEPSSEISKLIDQLTPEQQRLILAQIKGVLSSRE